MSIGYPPRVFRESALQTVMEARLRELFEVIKADLDGHDVTRLIGNGVLLCGGGALVPEIDTLASTVFNAPALIAEPSNVSGAEHEVQSPRYVTGIGMLHLGHRLRQYGDDAQGGWDVVKDELRRLFDLASRAIRF
jgi:cell division protein FtsA